MSDSSDSEYEPTLKLSSNEDVKDEIEESDEDKENNIFSKPWEDSDVVLVVEDNEFHVHRCILSLQSPVFKAMFNGNFKDSKQDKIELKDDKYEAMLYFLKVLYPKSMLDDLDEENGELEIDDDNIVKIVALADKYGARSVIKQCMKETENLEPKNTMRLLPYAARHELPLEKMFDVIARHVSTDSLEKFSPELDDDSVYIKALITKCRLHEDVAKRASTTILSLLKKYVAVEMDKDKFKSSAKCVLHKSVEVKNFKEARKCANCLAVYRKRFIDKYVYPYGDRRKSHSGDLIELLKLTGDIATSLQN